jgi:hypothetical protein
MRGVWGDDKGHVVTEPKVASVNDGQLNEQEDKKAEGQQVRRGRMSSVP